jgi:hypothetical protein
MTDLDITLLKALLDAPFEAAPARIWREAATEVADEVHTDAQGNVIATMNPGGAPRVMLAGHIDEIGLMITHIDDDGFLYLDGIGGWDSQVLVGQRMRVLGRAGEVIGVIGKKPIHLMTAEERDKVSKMSDLWVDVGARSRDERSRAGRARRRPGGDRRADGGAGQRADRLALGGQPDRRLRGPRGDPPSEGGCGAARRLGQRGGDGAGGDRLPGRRCAHQRLSARSAGRHRGGRHLRQRHPGDRKEAGRRAEAGERPGADARLGQPPGRLRAAGRGGRGATGSRTP